MVRQRDLGPSGYAPRSIQVWHRHDADLLPGSGDVLGPQAERLACQAAGLAQQGADRSRSALANLVTKLPHQEARGGCREAAKRDPYPQQCGHIPAKEPA